MLIIGFNGESFADVAKYLLTGSPVADPYMCMADFESYSLTQNKLSDLYANNKTAWNKKSLMNIASAGYFAADRSIRDYASDIWNIWPVCGK